MPTSESSPFQIQNIYHCRLQELLDSLPRCKQLLETFRASPNMQNKTPLAIVHEYASRFNLEVRLMLLFINWHLLAGTAACAGWCSLHLCDKWWPSWSRVHHHCSSTQQCKVLKLVLQSS